MTTKDFIKYFNKSIPFGSIFLIVVGCFAAIGVLFRIPDIGILDILITVVFLGGGIFLLHKHNEKSSDHAIDNYCKGQAEQFYKDTQTSFVSKYPDASEPVLYQNYCFENIFRARLARRGKDGLTRSSIYEMGCIYLVDEKAYAFSRKVSLIANEHIDKQNEFRLSDIQMLNIESSSSDYIVSVSIPGNEKISIHCQTADDANKLYGRFNISETGKT